MSRMVRRSSSFWLTLTAVVCLGTASLGRSQQQETQPEVPAPDQSVETENADTAEPTPEATASNDIAESAETPEPTEPTTEATMSEESAPIENESVEPPATATASASEESPPEPAPEAEPMEEPAEAATTDGASSDGNGDSNLDSESEMAETDPVPITTSAPPVASAVVPCCPPVCDPCCTERTRRSCRILHRFRHPRTCAAATCQPASCAPVITYKPVATCQPATCSAVARPSHWPRAHGWSSRHAVRNHRLGHQRFPGLWPARYSWNWPSR